MKQLVLSGLFLSTALLTGCASITNGTTQSVSIDTKNVQHANCSLTNSKGTWYIPDTPGSVVVHRSGSALQIACHKKGYKNAMGTFKPSLAPNIAGNVIFGGVIGAGADLASGAAFNYPPTIIVELDQEGATA